MYIDTTDFLQTLTNVLNTPTFVEGNDDKESLEKLGFTKVHTITDPVYKLVETTDADTVQILTDLDNAGKRMYGKLNSAFTERGVTVDNTLRHMLFKTDLNEIEGLYNYIRRHIKPHVLHQYLPHTI